MLLINIIPVFATLATAYPLGRSLRVQPTDEIASAVRMRGALQSPIPHFLPDVVTAAPLHLLADPTQSSSISSRELATSFVTTLLGGGLALYFT